MANVQKIVADIYAIQTNDELNQIVEAIKLKRTHLAKTMARSFSKGDLVQFRSKTGGTVKGSVVKVNIKYVIVDAAIGGTRYKVPASMLETI
jgi:hypothetical protein